MKACPVLGYENEQNALGGCLCSVRQGKCSHRPLLGRYEKKGPETRGEALCFSYMPFFVSPVEGFVLFAVTVSYLYTLLFLSPFSYFLLLSFLCCPYSYLVVCPLSLIFLFLSFILPNHCSSVLLSKLRSCWSPWPPLPNLYVLRLSTCPPLAEL